MTINNFFTFYSTAFFGTSQTGYALDANNKQICACYFAPGSAENDVEITHIGIAVVAWAGTSPTYRVSLQGMNALYPDGVIKTNGGACSATIQPTQAINFIWVELDNPYVPSIGEAISAVIDYSAGTIDGANYVTFGHSIRGIVPDTLTVPSTGWDTGGPAWTKSYGGPNICIKTSDNEVYIGGQPIADIITTSVNAATPRVGSIWTPNENVRCVGSIADYSHAVTSALFRLRDSDDNILRSILVDFAVIKAMNRSNALANWEPITLIKGQTYRFTVEKNTPDIPLYGALVSSLADGALVMGDLCGTEYTLATGEYTDYTTEPVTTHPVNFVSPILSGVDYGSGLVVGSGTG